MHFSTKLVTTKLRGMEGWVYLGGVVGDIPRWFACLRPVNHRSSNDLIARRPGVAPTILWYTERRLPYEMPPDTDERARLNRSQASRYSIYLSRKDGRLSWSWSMAIYRDGLPVQCCNDVIATWPDPWLAWPDS